MRPNAHVQAELARLEDEWTAGVNEGCEADPNRLPEFFSKPYTRLTARQRGYVWGRELRIHYTEEGIQ